MNLSSNEDGAIQRPSERSFGFVFASVFALVGWSPLWTGGQTRLWAVALSAVIGLVASARPALLAPFNRGWQQVGLAIHRVINPVAMAVLFYGVVTPFGLIMRLLGKGVVRQLRSDPAAGTYWISRAERPESQMDQQF